MFKQKVIAILLPVALLLCGCGPTPTEAPIAASAPSVGPFVPTDQPETRDLAPTTEVVSNCGGGDVTVVKHPSMTVLTSHSVEWEVGGEVGVGIKIGEGVVPGGVDLSGALDTHIKTGFEGGIQQGTAWDLPAKPNTIMEYTLMWHEIWQPGYIEARLADQSLVRVKVRYRTGIQSEIIGQRDLSCDSGQTTTQLMTPDTPTSPLTPPINTPMPSIDTPRPSIPGLKQAEVDAIFGAGNWFCFPDRDNGLGVKRLPADFTVQPPLRYIDTWIGRYKIGETSPGLTGATAELEGRLPKSECPSFQQEPLSAWASARASDTQPFTRTRLDEMFGVGNWQCLSDYTFAVKVNYLPSALIVQYPFTVIDVEDGTRYGVGETAPGGERATVWLAGSIPRDQCP